MPFLSVSEDGLTGSVVVGNGDDGGVWHPMVASDDPAVVHFVTHIGAGSGETLVGFWLHSRPCSC